MDFELETESVTLAPRFETEILVEKAVELLSDEPGLRRDILDIGTGCGNIAISLTKYMPLSRITALDISDTAIRVAKENARKYGIENRIEFVKSDLFKNIQAKRGLSFDLIISNPPYIALEDFPSLPEEVKADPYIALYGGRDGMDLYRKIINEARFFLKKGGFLLMETGYNQMPGIKAMLTRAGNYKEIKSYPDYSGIDRIIQATEGSPERSRGAANG